MTIRETKVTQTADVNKRRVVCFMMKWGKGNARATLGQLAADGGMAIAG
jgi:hypothetical protein